MQFRLPRIPSLLAVALLAVLFAIACGDDDDDGSDNGGNGNDNGAGGGSVVVISHDSFNVDADLLAAFEEEHDIEVELLPRGDAGAMLTNVILNKSNPEGDVVFGVDNTFLSRALDEDLFEPYEPERLANVRDEFTEGLDGSVTPIDYGYVNFNYDIAALEDMGLEPPTTLEELTQPEWEGLVVVENPASSTPGLAFLVATVAYFGEDEYLDWWEAMRDNGLVVVDGWETAYNTNFTLAGGEQPIVLSYSTSPAFEQMFAEPAREDSPTGNLLPEGGVFRQVEYAGILQNASNKEGARLFIDFLLSQEFQETVPLQMAVYPVVDDADVPDAFEEFGAVDVEPADISSEEIAEGRDAWIEAWTSAVLR